MRIEPWSDTVAEITPRQFELLVKSHLERLGGNLKSFDSKHDEKLKTSDGSYQIDVTARFEALGVEFLVLIECKHQRHPIKREKIQVLFDKIRATGAQKGILFASIGFQRGAIKYAKSHGIALVRIVEGKLTYEVKSNIGPVEPPPWVKIPEFVAIYIEHEEENKIRTSDVSEGDIEPLENFLFR